LHILRIVVTIIGILFFRTGCGSEPTGPDDKAVPPDPPRYLTITSISEKSLRLEWSKGSNVSYYDIERADSSYSFLKIGVANATTPSFTDYGLDRSRMYFYRVRAIRDTLAGSYSNIVKVGYQLSIQPVRIINDDATRLLAISSDGNYLVGYGRNNTFSIWNTSNWSMLRPANSSEDIIAHIAITKNSNYIVTNEYSSFYYLSKIKIWQPSDGKLIRTFTLDTILGAAANSIAVTPDGTILAEADYRGRLQLWKLADGSHLQLLDTLSYDVSCCSAWDIAISPKTNILVAASYRSLKIWNLDTRQVIHNLSGSFSIPIFNQTGSMIMINSSNMATYYRTSDWTYLYSLGSYKSVVAFSPNDSLEIFADQNMIRIARTSDGSLVQTVLAHSDLVQSIVFFPDGQQFATTGNDNTIKIWSTSLAQQWTIVF